MRVWVGENGCAECIRKLRARNQITLLLLAGFNCCVAKGGELSRVHFTHFLKESYAALDASSLYAMCFYWYALSHCRSTPTYTHIFNGALCSTQSERSVSISGDAKITLATTKRRWTTTHCTVKIMYARHFACIQHPPFNMFSTHAPN